MFSSDLAIELLNNRDVNEHVIELVKEKQPPYKPIYTLNPVEFGDYENLHWNSPKTGFIYPLKSFANAPTLFDKKFISIFYLYVNYQGLNNLIIMNQYLVPFIDKLLDWLGQAKRFTQLYLTGIYY